MFEFSIDMNFCSLYYNYEQRFYAIGERENDEENLWRSF